MSLFALVTLVASTVPSADAAMVVSRRNNVSAADAQALALQISAMLRDLEVPLALGPDVAATRLAKLGVADPAACAGRRACIAELGAQLEVGWVLAVSVSRVDVDRSLALELMRVKDQVVVEADALILPPKAKVSPAMLDGFAIRARAALKTSDAPLKVDPDPTDGKLLPDTPPDKPPDIPMVAATERPHTIAYLLGGAGAVAVGAAAALLLLSFATRAELARGTAVGGGVVQSGLRGSEANAKNDLANLELMLAGAGAGVGLGLGAAAILTW